MRYSKHRKPNILPEIKTKNLQFRQLVQREEILTSEVAQLNHILNTQGLVFINDLIFTSEIKNRLPDDILQCISKQHRLLSFGFQLWKAGSDSPKLFKKQLIESKLTFKQKLHEMSIKSVEKYEQQKHKHLIKLNESRWKVNSTVQSKVSPNFLGNQQISVSTNLTSTKVSDKQGIYRYKTTKKIATEMPEEQNNDLVTEYEIEKLLKKQKNLVSIWLPPKTYPQFYGIIVPSIASTTSGNRCRIKKYILFKQGLSQRFFLSILEYLKKLFDMSIDSLQMIMTKSSYLSFFKNCGWKMKSWQGVDKINAIFTGLAE